MAPGVLGLLCGTSFAIITPVKKALVVLVLFSSGCHVVVIVFPHSAVGRSVMCNCGIHLLFVFFLVLV